MSWQSLCMSGFIKKELRLDALKSRSGWWKKTMDKSIRILVNHSDKLYEKILLTVLEYIKNSGQQIQQAKWGSVWTVI